MCDCWKDPQDGQEKELDLRSWISVIDSLSGMKAEVITITGGEPLLREDIFDILKYITERKISSHICTNGQLLSEKTIDKLVEAGLGSISVSLDSHKANIHNEMRGLNCFEEVVANVRLLKTKYPCLKLGINCVITKVNFRDISLMVPFAEQLGADQIKFDPVHSNLMHRNKPRDSFKGILFEKEDLDELGKELKKLVSVCRKSKIITNSHTFMDGVANFFTGRKPFLPCYAGYISCAIDPFGYISVCDNFDGTKSLKKASFKEIWISRELKDLRRKVRSCSQHCWDSTHGELNIRCSPGVWLKEWRQILSDFYFYTGKCK